VFAQGRGESLEFIFAAQHGVQLTVIADVIAVVAIGGSLEQGRCITVADPKVMQIGHNGLGIGEFKSAVELNPVCGRGDTHRIFLSGWTPARQHRRDPRDTKKFYIVRYRHENDRRRLRQVLAASSENHGNDRAGWIHGDHREGHRSDSDYTPGRYLPWPIFLSLANPSPAIVARDVWLRAV
jgi:hypothetical protein